MIKKKYHIVDVKGRYHIQKSCILIWKHYLNKSTHNSLNLKLKTLNDPNDKCSQPNDYTNKTTNGIQYIYNNFVLNLKVNQLKIIMNGSISLRV
jgi:hypothetical protein